MPSAERRLKLNVDTVMEDDVPKWGYGVERRRGLFCAAQVGFYDSCLTVQVESFVLKEGLSLVIDLGVDILHVESDSQLLIQYLMGDIRPIPSLATVIKDIDYLFIYF